MALRPIFNQPLGVEDGQAVHRMGYSADSGDTKPAPADLAFKLAGSSFIIENDSGQISTWSESEQDWIPQFSIKEE